MRRWWRRFWNGRVHAYEITGTELQYFLIGDIVMVMGERYRVWGYATDHDVVYLW